MQARNVLGTGSERERSRLGASGASMADKEAADNTNNSLSPSFLLQAGEILENNNKKDEALKIYQNIKKKYVNSPIYGEIDKYIERVSVK